jgi:hypothetical protein
MNRIFLAFMALLAGLAAQVAPTAARVSEDTQIGAAKAARTLERQVAVEATAAVARPSQPYALAAKAGLTARSAQSRVLAPVLIGIDRARE